MDDSTWMPPTVIDQTGVERRLGTIPTAPALLRAYPRFSPPLLPRSEWKEIDFQPYWDWIRDQGSQGSCNGHGATATLECLRALSGMTPVRLSPCYAYGLCNDGQDRGSTIGDMFQAMRTKGTCRESTVGPGKIFPPWPANADEEALEFRSFLAYLIEGNVFDGVATALHLNFPCNIGIDIGRNFKTDAEGYCYEMSGSGGGHAMAVMGLHYGRSKWWLKTANSWGRRWGRYGWLYLPESYFRSSFNEAFALQGIVEAPGESTTPPVVRAA